jgi:hypothetical protein
MSCLLANNDNPIDGQEKAVKRGTDDHVDNSHNEYRGGIGEHCDYGMYLGALQGQVWDHLLKKIDPDRPSPGLLQVHRFSVLNSS